MKQKPRKYVFGNIIALSLLTGFIFLTPNPSLAAIGDMEPQKKTISAKEYQAEDPHKVLDILEKKMGGKKLPPKVQEKLFNLSGNQTHLILSLCERISDDGGSPGADIAYLLVIALILIC